MLKRHLRQLVVYSIIASLACGASFADEPIGKIEPVEFVRTPTILNCNGKPEEDQEIELVGTYKGSVLMVDIDTGKDLARLEPLPVHRLMPIRAIDYYPAKQLVMAVGGYDGAETMRLYKLKKR